MRGTVILWYPLCSMASITFYRDLSASTSVSGHIVTVPLYFVFLDCFDALD